MLNSILCSLVWALNNVEHVDFSGHSVNNYPIPFLADLARSQHLLNIDQVKVQVFDVQVQRIQLTKISKQKLY